MAPELRQQCEADFSRRVQTLSRTTSLPGGWQLVKTPDPRGGSPKTSLMHVSDSSRSDIGLAGLTFRCGPTGVEALLVMLDPLPSVSRPMVTVKTGQQEKQFQGTAVDGGQMLQLSPEASIAAASTWTDATELSLEIATTPTPVRGVIPATGLRTALPVLSQSCTGQ